MTIGSECQPWHISAGGTQVGGPASPVLTIKPCVTIEVDPEGYLIVAGTGNPGGLVAVGTAEQHITFTSSATTPMPGDWGPVGILDTALYPTTALAFVDISYGGYPQNGQDVPSLQVDDSQGRLILLHDLTISDNLTDGIHLVGSGGTTGVGFATGSGNLTIPDWGNGHSPIVIDVADAASTVPATLKTGMSGHDGQVELTGSNGLVVDVNETWPSLPIPYLLDASLSVLGAGNSSATLTIAAPNVIQSLANGQILVDFGGTDQGYLVAHGTNGNIVFTTNSPNPAPGDWEGIYFQAGPGGQGPSSLTGCTIEYAGANQSEGGCGAPAPVVVTTSNVAGPTISGNIIQDYASTDYGIDVAAGTTNAASYSNNTFNGANLGNVCVQ
jgi:hypothetical protein